MEQKAINTILLMIGSAFVGVTIFKYSIRLPPGKYQVSGYELNSYLTDKKFAGKLESQDSWIKAVCR